MGFALRYGTLMKRYVTRPCLTNCVLSILANIYLFDSKHGNGFSMELVALQEHTTLVEVEPGEHLYNNGIDRGLFFIESGIMVSYERCIP